MDRCIATHYLQSPVKVQQPNCMCCWMGDRRKVIPKLIPSYMALHRTSVSDIDDSVRVSVIKKPDFPDVPLRKLSVSSTDRQSTDSYFTDKHYDDLSEHRRSVSPTYRPYDIKMDRRGIFKTQPNTAEVGYVKRKKLTVLQCDDTDYRRPHPDTFVNYREIPSPGYPTSPRYYVNESSVVEPPQFVFTPYMDSSLRSKYCADMTSFPDLSRGIKKRHRTIFTPSQLRKLEEKFNECNFIVGEDRQLLAKQLKLKEHQVKIWFQNRRTKVKQSDKDTTTSEIDVVS